ncbi:MAG: hypothetical protein Q9169_007120 [Polycauliona sp. 2 TL-2023]
MIISSFSTVVLATLGTLNSVHGSVISARSVDGINDRGSSECRHADANNMELLQTAVDSIQPGTTYRAGEKIACASYYLGRAICAFLCNNDETFVSTCYASEKADLEQNDPDRLRWSPNARTTWGDVIGDLRYIGAKGCGTAPLLRGQDPDNPGKGYPNSSGCIKVNWVTDPCEKRAPELCDR